MSVVPLEGAGAQSQDTVVLVPSNGATVSGTSVVLDASASGGRATQVQFELTGGSLSHSVIATASLTYYGWIAEWNSTTVANGTYTLESVATSNGVSAISAVISITVGNVPLATQMLIPSPAGGQAVVGLYSSTVVLDASAQGTDITGVQFVVSFGPVRDEVVATATPTLYGWIGEWDLSAYGIPSAPPGASLQSVVTQAGGATAMSAPVSVLMVPSSL